MPGKFPTHSNGTLTFPPHLLEAELRSQVILITCLFFFFSNKDQGNCTINSSNVTSVNAAKS